MNKPMTCWMVKYPGGKFVRGESFETFELADKEWGRLVQHGYRIVKVEIREVQ